MKEIAKNNIENKEKEFEGMKKSNQESAKKLGVQRVYGKDIYDTLGTYYQGVYSKESYITMLKYSVKGKEKFINQILNQIDKINELNYGIDITEEGYEEGLGEKFYSKVSKDLKKLYGHEYNKDGSVSDLIKWYKEGVEVYLRAITENYTEWTNIGEQIIKEGLYIMSEDENVVREIKRLLKKTPNIYAVGTIENLTKKYKEINNREDFIKYLNKEYKNVLKYGKQEIQSVTGKDISYTEIANNLTVNNYDINKVIKSYVKGSIDEDTVIKGEKELKEIVNKESLNKVTIGKIQTERVHKKAKKNSVLEYKHIKGKYLKDNAKFITRGMQVKLEKEYLNSIDISARKTVSYTDYLNDAVSGNIERLLKVKGKGTKLTYVKDENKIYAKGSRKIDAEKEYQKINIPGYSLTMFKYDILIYGNKGIKKYIDRLINISNIQQKLIKDYDWLENIPVITFYKMVENIENEKLNIYVYLNSLNPKSVTGYLNLIGIYTPIMSVILPSTINGHFQKLKNKNTLLNYRDLYINLIDYYTDKELNKLYNSFA